MKKIIILILCLVPLINFAAPLQHKPEVVVAQLLRIYKRHDYRTALFLTMGKEQRVIRKTMKIMNNNFGRPPKQLAAFVAKIQDLKILNTHIKDNYARVDVIWILKVTEPKNRQKYQIKVNEVAYLLKKVKRKWFIKDSKFLKQHMFYNYQEVYKIMKKATPFDKVKRTGRRSGGRRRGGRRYRGYRRR